MEGLTRLVSESLARHGFDRPLDYRRLHWSRWFRCESVRSLLFVPSQPGVFALAEEIMEMDSATAHVATGASPVPRSEASGPPVPNPAEPMWGQPPSAVRPSEARLDLAVSSTAPTPRRMLAVTQFFEDDDMAFVLDRMLSSQNPMRARLVSGRYFVRFVVIEDASQRRSICAALNQWIANSGEKASGIGAHFATSLELTDPDVGNGNAGRTLPSTDSEPALSLSKGQALSATADTAALPSEPGQRNLGVASVHAAPATASQPDSAAATSLHCPAPFPSGF